MAAAPGRAASAAARALANCASVSAWQQPLAHQQVTHLQQPQRHVLAALSAAASASAPAPARAAAPSPGSRCSFAALERRHGAGAATFAAGSEHGVAMRPLASMPGSSSSSSVSSSVSSMSDGGSALMGGSRSRCGVLNSQPEGAVAVPFGGASRGFFSSSDPEPKKWEQRRLVGWRPDQFYAVVSDVDNYHKFVPWCQKSKVVRKSKPTYFEAELEVGFQVLVERYVSEVTLVPGRMVRSNVRDSMLFHHLDSSWVMEPGPTPNSCWLTFKVDFAFNSMIYSNLADLFFSEVVKRMTGAFEGRCEKIYGQSSLMRPRAGGHEAARHRGLCGLAPGGGGAAGGLVTAARPTTALLCQRR